MLKPRCLAVTAMTAAAALLLAACSPAAVQNPAAKNPGAAPASGMVDPSGSQAGTAPVASGKGQAIDIPAGSPVTAVSRDGKRLLYLTPGRNEDANRVGNLGVYDIPGKVSYDLGTLRHSDHWGAAFSPDGSRLAMSASVMIDGRQPYVAWTLDLKMR